MTLDPIVRGDDRVFTYTAESSLVGATVRFRLYSDGFAISKSTAAGTITIAGATATIRIGGADWDSYPATHKSKHTHYVELEIVTAAGKRETPVRGAPIDVYRDAIV